MSETAAGLAILVAEFNHLLMESMLIAAKHEVMQANATVLNVVRVPGCYEVPLIAAELLAREQVDALVVLGYIERGETLHGEVMGHVVHGALMELSLRHKKPIGLGIIGPGATKEQADVRKDAYARAAVNAALNALKTAREISR